MRRESIALRARRLAIAAFLLAGTRVSLAVLPYAWVARIVDRLTRAPAWLRARSPARVAADVTVAARVLPGAACLAQALTTTVLLAWQGSPSTVRLGVRRDGRDMAAHAWVEHEGVVLLGGPDVSSYVPLEPARPVDVR